MTGAAARRLLLVTMAILGVAACRTPPEPAPARPRSIPPGRMLRLWQGDDTLLLARGPCRFDERAHRVISLVDGCRIRLVQFDAGRTHADVEGRADHVEVAFQREGRVIEPTPEDVSWLLRFVEVTPDRVHPSPKLPATESRPRLSSRRRQDANALLREAAESLFPGPVVADLVTLAREGNDATAVALADACAGPLKAELESVELARILRALAGRPETPSSRLVQAIAGATRPLLRSDAATVLDRLTPRQRELAPAAAATLIDTAAELAPEDRPASLEALLRPDDRALADAWLLAVADHVEPSEARVRLIGSALDRIDAGIELQRAVLDAIDDLPFSDRSAVLGRLVALSWQADDWHALTGTAIEALPYAERLPAARLLVAREEAHDIVAPLLLTHADKFPADDRPPLFVVLVESDLAPELQLRLLEQTIDIVPHEQRASVLETLLRHPGCTEKTRRSVIAVLDKLPRRDRGKIADLAES